MQFLSEIRLYNKNRKLCIVFYNALLIIFDENYVSCWLSVFENKNPFWFHA